MEAERRRQDPEPPPENAVHEEQELHAGADVAIAEIEESGVEEVEFITQVVVDEDGYLLPEAGEYPSDSGAGPEDGESDYIQSSDDEEDEEYCGYSRRR